MMIDFPNNKLFILKVNPARKRTAYFHAVALSGLFLLTTIGQDPMKQYFDGISEAKKIDEMRPLMNQLAEQGKPPAVVWMFKYDYEAAKASGFTALTDAALTGDPESMWAYGVLQLDLGRYAVAMIWIEKAAAGGYPDAVRYMQFASQQDEG